jgi:hypothetical protein
MHGSNDPLSSLETIELPWKQLKAADIRAVIDVIALRLPHCDHLRVLKIVDMGALDTIQSTTLIHLETLCLWRVGQLKPTTLDIFYHSTRSLYHLEIGGLIMPAKVFEPFLSECINLKRLNLGGFLYGTINDKTLAVLHHLKSLKHLGVHTCYHITNDGMVKLAKHLCVGIGGNLATICASNNREITQELVGQAKNLGVTVTLDRPKKNGSFVNLPALI